MLTAGPWYVGNGEIYDAEFRRIAFIGLSHKLNGNNGAHPDVATFENACLLAMAPEMFALIQRAVEIAGGKIDKTFESDCRAVLREAKGGSHGLA